LAFIIRKWLQYDHFIACCFPKVFLSNRCYSLGSSCGNYIHVFWVHIQKSGRDGASDLILVEVSQVCSIRDSWNLWKGNLSWHQL